MSSNLPPIVLQYVDDTLIIARESTSVVSHLKSVLVDLALAIGLQIN